jgi:predicted MPP superfamily phosphohydrolase
MHTPSHVAFIASLLSGIAVLALIVGSQVFWIKRVRELGRQLIPNPVGRLWAGRALAAYAALWVYEIARFFWDRTPAATEASASVILIDGPFSWWIFGSVVGFLMVLILRLPDYLWRGIRWLYLKTTSLLAPATGHPVSTLPVTSRRQFLRTATTAVGTLPFIGGFYGLVFGRLDVEVVRQRIHLERLPPGFNGFRIVQLSDIHIGPFMTGSDIRHVVDIAQGLKGDLIVLSGDYVTWDPTTQGAAVEALSGLRASFGVFGCLGNHEAWTGVTDSITRLFDAHGVRILRRQNATLRAGGDELNLIGVDFQTRRPAGAHYEGVVGRYLVGVESLVRKDTANILMSHNPNTFDRATELGIDLSLAGHTHGGQVALEFVSPQIAPSRLVTPYVAGWFGKPGGQLYVNRGIGTIGPPIRWGAPPEITVFELAPSA